MAGQDEPGKQPGATPSAAQPGTSEEPTTFTREQLDAAVGKARNDALADVGRLKKASAEAVRTAQAATERIDQLLKEQDERELEAAQDDPVGLVAIREKHKRRTAESNLATLRQESAQKDERLKLLEDERAERERGRIVVDVATRFNVDPSRLAKMAQYTDGSAEAIEDAAKQMPQGAAKPPLKPDSSGTIGGAISREQVRDAYIKDPRDPAVRRRYLEMRAAGGR